MAMDCVQSAYIGQCGNDSGTEFEDALIAKRKVESDEEMVARADSAQSGRVGDDQQDNSSKPAKMARGCHQSDLYSTSHDVDTVSVDSASSNYRVWWGHNAMEMAESFHWEHTGLTQSYTMTQLWEERGDRVVTHMTIVGAVPPDLHKLAPQLSHLSVESVEVTSNLFSITKLRELKVLYLTKCDFSSGLPSSVSNLEFLRKLSVTHCLLTELPPSISRLTVLNRLDISYNDFSCEFPSVVSDLVSLKELHLSFCKLTNLPETFSRLQHLELLYLTGNNLAQVPSIIFKLGQLQTLDLSENDTLQTLDPRITKMEQLQNMCVESCVALGSPPRTVCEQGPQAIKQFYMDIALGTGQKIPVATVAVIGKSRAGKTSLIRALQNISPEDELVRHVDGACLNEATKVGLFNVEEVRVKDKVLRFVDLCSRHEIYRVAYQLTLRDNSVPVLVVNMEQYKNLADDEGVQEAVRSVCFDLISHLFLLQPSLEFPKLVLTHKDKFSPEDFQILQDQFLDAANSLRDSIVMEEKDLEKTMFSQIKHFSNYDTPMFKSEDIFAIGNPRDQQVYDAIRSSLYQACQQQPIPRIWEEINLSLQSREGSFSTFDELFSEFHQTHRVTQHLLETVLTFLHDTGKLLWYKNIPVLSQIVFHSIPDITAVLSVLCDHSKSVWQGRVDRLVEVGHLVESFLKTGIMNEVLLLKILQNETTFKSDSQLKAALAILTSFRLIYGPVHRRTDRLYVIPCYAVGNLDQKLDMEKDLTFQVDILFKGLALPQYVYYQMTTALLEMSPSETDVPVMRQDGASIHHGRSTISLTHDCKMRKVTIRLSADIEKITNSWRHLMDITNGIIKYTLGSYRASRMVCIFHCPHCLLIGDIHPKKTVNPAWCVLSDTRPNSDVRYRLYSGMEPVVCGNARDVPKPLKFPCVGPTQPEMEMLKMYVGEQKLKKSSHHPVQGTLETISPSFVSDEGKGPDFANDPRHSDVTEAIKSLDTLLAALQFRRYMLQSKLVKLELDLTGLRSTSDMLSQNSAQLETLAFKTTKVIAKQVEPVTRDEMKQLAFPGVFMAGVFQKDKDGRTPLHDAKDREIAESLLKVIEPDKQRELLLAGDGRQQTALHVSAEYGRADVVKYLIDRYKTICVEQPNELVTAKDIHDNTALHYADNREIAELLVNGVEPGQRQKFILAGNTHRRTAVHKAAKECRTDIVKYLTTTYGGILKDSILGRDFKGKTALHYACNGDIAGLLVDAVSPDQLLGFLLASDYNQRSALHTAAKYGRTDVVERLCNHTLADDKLMLKRDQTGRTALFYASAKETAVVLIGAVEDKLVYLSMVDNDGNTAVMNHISCGSLTEVAEYILECIREHYKNSDLEQYLQLRNQRGQNLIHLIGISPYVREFSEILLKYLPILDIENVIQPDEYGNTPLSYVASRYSTRNFAELITRMSLSQRKYFIQQTNKKGVDCLSIVRKRQFSELFYLRFVLCDQRSAKEMTYFWAFDRPFRDDFKYDENMLKVLKYALNEYSLLDSVYKIPHTLSCGSAADEIVPNLGMSPSISLQLRVDCEKLDVPVIQKKLNSMDIPGNHGKPKVAVIRTLDATGITKLTPPGPDYLIVSALCTELFNTRPLSSSSGDVLVEQLRTDVNVECVTVNSTLGRTYLRDVSESESSMVMSPVDQVLISGRNRGKALIICNRHNRYDWQQEFEHANHVLTYHFGLQVELALDLAAEQIPKAVSKFSNSAKHVSLLVLAVMSHGDNHGNIAGDDGEHTVSVQEVVNSLCTPQLEAIPKIAFLSFCRGGIGRYNRTYQSFESTTLASMSTSESFNPVRRGLTEDQLKEAREMQQFPALDVPLNSYICYATLPDSKSYRGTMFRCFTEYLTDMYKHSPLKEGEDVDPDTSVYKRELPRVELIELFTDVAGVVRETSQFTQYMNYCYKLNQDSQPVVIEIIPTRRDIF